MCLFTNELLISHLSHRVSSRSALAVKTSTCRATFISISWMACLDPSPAVDRLCLLRLSWLQWLVGRHLAVDFTPPPSSPRASEVGKGLPRFVSVTLRSHVEVSLQEIHRQLLRSLSQCTLQPRRSLFSTTSDTRDPERKEKHISLNGFATAHKDSKWRKIISKQRSWQICTKLRYL